MALTKEEETKLAQLVSLQDRDIENGLLWFSKHTEAAQLYIWNKIQEMPDVGPIGVISRFAQLGYTQLVILELERKRDQP